VPFTAENLVTAVGFSKKAARSLLQRWKAAGWVESTDRGQYRKTDKFPATVIPAE
jgi:DNA-binding transcriptional regulator PaaX